MKKFINKIIIAIFIVNILLCNSMRVFAISFSKINLSGASRIETSINIAERGVNDTKNPSSAIIVGYTAYVDALSASGLVGDKNAPIFYNTNNGTTVNEKVKATLKKYGVTNVYIIGGSAVVPSSVEKDLKSIGITNVSRIAGDNRYLTSVAIAKSMSKVNGILLVKSSLDECVSAAMVTGIAAQNNFAVLYRDSENDMIAANYINSVKKTNNIPVYTIGGVSEKGIECKTEKIAGANRYETNKLLINKFGNYEKVILVGNAVDAASASYLAKAENASVILATSTSTSNYDKLKMSKSTKVIYKLCNQINSDILVSGVQNYGKPVEALSVVLDKKSNTLPAYSSFTLKATILPTDVANKTITWKSSNTKVATVQNGIVKTLSEGSCTITATTANGKSASCTITVKGLGNKYGISEKAMDFLAGVIFWEEGTSKNGQIAVGYVVKNRMDGNYSTEKLLKVLTSKNQYASVTKTKSKVPGSSQSISFNGNTYYTKKYTTQAKEVAYSVMNGVVSNPIGNRKYFYANSYYRSHPHKNAITLGSNTFFDW